MAAAEKTDCPQCAAYRRHIDKLSGQIKDLETAQNADRHFVTEAERKIERLTRRAAAAAAAVCLALLPVSEATEAPAVHSVFWDGDHDCPGLRLTNMIVGAAYEVYSTVESAALLSADPATDPRWVLVRTFVWTNNFYWAGDRNRNQQEFYRVRRVP